MVEKRTCYRNDGQPLLSYGEALFLVEDSEKEIARLKAENRELRELLEEGCDRLKCWKDHDCGGWLGTLRTTYIWKELGTSSRPKMSTHPAKCLQVAANGRAMKSLRRHFLIGMKLHTHPIRLPDGLIAGNLLLNGSRNG
jgi:hypothetical protein